MQVNLPIRHMTHSPITICTGSIHLETYIHLSLHQASQPRGILMCLARAKYSSTRHICTSESQPHRIYLFFIGGQGITMKIKFCDIPICQGTSSQRSTIGKQYSLKSSKSVRPSSIFSVKGWRHGGTGTSDRLVRPTKMG